MRGERFLLIGAFAFFSLFFLLNLYALAGEGTNIYSYHAFKYDGDPKVKIDGKLDEPIWKRLKPITNFIQTDPDEGAPATERTEVYIFYDNKNIYFGFICYDSQPNKILAYVTRRDNFRSSDSITILLDTFHNLRNGYSFTLNARGVQRDERLSEVTGGGGRGRGRGAPGLMRDRNWDGIWMSAARITDFGWTAEIAIPFRTLRFKPGKDQVWGLNISRYIMRKNETVCWVPVKRYDRDMRPSKAGELTGISDIYPGRNMEFLPFFVYRNESHVEDELDTVVSRPKLGLNFRYGITSDLVADFTLNPDFAQTEVDVENIRLSKYELFYPEKRAFFMEGADIFKTPIQLFFSRRIGRIFPDYSEQPLALGGKVIGSIGKQRIGIIEAVMSPTSYYDPDDGEYQDVAGANFFVFRWQRDILKKSSIGFITVNRDQRYDGELDTQRAHGVDLALNLGDHTRIYSQFAASSQPGDNADFMSRTAFVAGASYRSNQFEASFGFQNIGEDFDVSRIGYYPRVDRLGGDGSVEFRPYIFSHGIRYFSFRTSYSRLFNHSGELEDGNVDFSFGVNLSNFWYMGASYSITDERYFVFEDGEENSELTTIYRKRRLSFRVFSPWNKPIGGRLMFSKGDYIDYADCFFGENYSLSLGMNARIGTKLSLDFDVNYIREFYSDGRFQENRGLYVTRVNYSFNHKARIRFVGQYNVETAQFIADSLFTYDFTARSGFYIGFRDRRNLDPTSTAPEEKRFFFKISYLLSL